MSSPYELSDDMARVCHLRGRELVRHAPGRTLRGYERVGPWCRTRRTTGGGPPLLDALTHPRPEANSAGSPRMRGSNLSGIKRILHLERELGAGPADGSRTACRAVRAAQRA